MPTLGDLGKHSSSLIHSDFAKVGSPIFKQHIAVSVLEVPFTKSKYKKYADVELSKGKSPKFSYVDSIVEKPKYLTLEISDKIRVKEVLNTEENKSVQSYLKNDSDISLISRISLVLNEQEKNVLTAANAIYLVSNKNEGAVLEIIKGQDRSYLNISTLEVFDYEVSEFCWGETKYGKLKIEALKDKGEGCPRGTEKKARKLKNKRSKSYLKL